MKTDIISLSRRKDDDLITKQDSVIKRLEQENDCLCRQNLKLTSENEFVKKIERFSRLAGQEPKTAEIAQAVTQLKRELKVSVTFIPYYH